MVLPSISNLSHGSYIIRAEQKQSTSGAQNESVIFAKYEKGPQKTEGVIKTERENIPASTRSVNALQELQTGLLNTTEFVMDKLKLNKNTLLQLPGLLKATDPNVRLATQQEMQTTKKLQKKLINHVAVLFSNKNRLPLKEVEKIIRQEFKEAATKLRNNKQWEQVQTSFKHNNNEYICTLIPAGKMKIGSSDIFQHSYLDKGVCSSSTEESIHATNLWTSEIAVPSEEGKTNTLFKGVRHGILSPYGLKKDDPSRQTGALSRAKEVVTAALYAKPDLLKKALAGQEVPLQIVSTSLVTASQIGKEDEMLKDQMSAWQLLGKQTPVSLFVRDENGKLQQVKVKLGVVAFNFGVNEMALKFGLGRSTSDKYNAQALNQLLGSDLKPSSLPGGMVGEYLKSRPKNHPKVMALSQQLKQILINKSHHHDGGEPYKAAQRVAMLAYEIGAVPCWNCKSGKDRTGMLDAEIKREAVSQHQGSPLNKPGIPLSNNDKKLFQQVLLNGGNSEVQAYNTGVAGNKVLKKLPLSALNLSYHERIDNRKVWEEGQGLSGLVKS
ncbi:inositol phosphate phosphatase SopB [Serratia proteamaculans]